MDERAHGSLPRAGETGWVLRPSADRRLARVREALLTVADGSFGTRAVDEREPSDVRTDPVLAGGAYGPEPPGALLAAPDWTRSGIPGDGGGEWAMSLSDGVVRHDAGAFAAARFAAAARPGTAALRFLGHGETSLAAPAGTPSRVASGPVGADGVWMALRTPTGAVAAAVLDTRTGVVTDRIAAFARGGTVETAVEAARRRLEAGAAAGWDGLLAEQRTVWRRRWEQAGVDIDGDPRAELAVRVAVAHLLSSAGGEETALGARGLTGPGYLGHVFWDTDVFVLPALVALAPAAARSLVEYRLRRLPAARAEAAARGRAGARFPWESAGSGRDVTPASAVDPTGKTVPILTGIQEEHITADVAWAAARYAEWTGDDILAGDPGAALLVETARYWASRVESDASGAFHIRHVIGPDEYHEDVDDNTYTNVMARWNLATAARRFADGPLGSEAAAWSAIASRLVDGFDPALGRHHEFAGFDTLEPVIISRLSATPVAADILLGYERVRESQVIKQADVLMAHHVLPDAMVPGALNADIDFALPRTAHGSSLSPAVHASVLARAHRPEEALVWFDVAAGIDVDDLTGTTGAGVHIGAMGGLWQALAFGFLGIRARGTALAIDPVLPDRWRRVRLALTYRGVRLDVAAAHGECTVEADDDVTVHLGDGAARGRSLRFRLGDAGWEAA